MRQQERLRVLREQCISLKLSQDLGSLTRQQLDAMDFMVDDKHQILLKAVTKTGCTSWRSILINSVEPGTIIGAFQRKRYCCIFGVYI